MIRKRRGENREISKERGEMRKGDADERGGQLGNEGWFAENPFKFN